MISSSTCELLLPFSTLVVVFVVFVVLVVVVVVVVALTVGRRQTKCRALRLLLVNCSSFRTSNVGLSWRNRCSSSHVPSWRMAVSCETRVEEVFGDGEVEVAE